MTEHFRLSEFTRSATAQRYGIRNIPTRQHIENLRYLCEQVLEPLRRHADCPIVISSGYRSSKLNAQVGGVRNSQHQTGEAADISIPKIPVGPSGQPHTDLVLGREWMEWILQNCLYDQCIWETANGQDFWIHVSCHRNLYNRGTYIEYLRK